MPRELFSLEMAAWLASFLNVIAMAFQLRSLIKAWDAKGVSLVMLGVFCYVQATYMRVGYHSGQWALFWGMLFSLLFTAASAGIVVYLRYWPDRWSFGEWK